MKKTIVTSFGDFLYHDRNSAEGFLKEIPDSINIHKQNLPVGYFKRDLIKPIKEYNPQRVIFLGMNTSIKNPQFEIVTTNNKITLKNPVYRFFVYIYSYWLKWNNKNLRVKKPIPKDKLIEIPIERNNIKEIMLHTKPPKLKGIGTSKNAGNYVCNYSMWIVENYIRKNSRDIDFYFIHLPSKISEKHKQQLLKFILKSRINK